MLSRRLLLGLVAAGLLSACTPLVPEDQAASVVVRTVTVDTSKFVGVRGRDISVSAEQVKADATAALVAELRPSPRGNADVLVAVDSVWLVSPGQSYMVGGLSTIKGRVQVTDAASRKVIVPSSPVTGLADHGWLRGGLIGALSTKSPQSDYEYTVASFAADVKLRLFGTNK